VGLLLKWLFEHLRAHPDFDDVLQFSGDERFFRLYDALHDDAYRNTSPGTLCRRSSLIVRVEHISILAFIGGNPDQAS
jgi:hypothetical protein